MIDRYLSQITAEVSTGEKAYTGVGFQPKVLLFFANLKTAVGNSANSCFSMGVATATDERWTIGNSINDGDSAAPLARICYHSANACLQLNDVTNTTLIELDFVSFDSDGFTVNYTVVDGSAYLITVLALGGDELTNVFAGHFIPPTIAEEKAIEDVGFKPDLVLFGSCRLINSDVASSMQVVNMCIGFATGKDRQAVLLNRSDNILDTESNSYQNDQYVLGNFNKDDELGELASFVKMDDDGFTVDFDQISFASRFFFLALKGGSYGVGRFTQPQSVSVQSVVGVGFQPSVILFLTSCQEASDNILDNARLGFGAAVGPSNEVGYFSGDKDAVSETEDTQSVVTTSCILCYIEDAALPGISSRADFLLMGSDGFALNWEYVDQQEREIIYLAIGDDNNDSLRRQFND